jgi:hypothetical protein
MKVPDLLMDLLACSIAVLLGLSYQRYLSVRSELGQFRITNLNNTANADQEGLIFNRVPKVGSETIWSLIDRLAFKNGFNSFSDSMEVKNQRGGENNYLATREQRESYVKILLENCTKPYSYVKHLNFLDLTEFGLQNPVYINFVRHPVDRVISWYYYKRSPWHIVQVDKTTNVTNLHDRAPPLQELKMTFEECVRSGYYECVYNKGQGIYSSYFGGSHYSQIAFFCGNGPECDGFETPEALAKAKDNVEKYFAVVGVLEDMDRSLELLENYVPRFFRDARSVYKELMRATHVNKNIFKPKTPSDIRQSLMANFSMEIEFYEYCKQRLNRQYLAL